MTCQNCGYPHANPLGCMSCGWKYDPNYHPVLGTDPINSALWVMGTSRDTLVRLHGHAMADQKIEAAKRLLENLKPVAPTVKPIPETVITQDKSPDPAPAVPVDDAIEAEFEDVPVPVADERMFAEESDAPVGD